LRLAPRWSILWVSASSPCRCLLAFPLLLIRQANCRNIALKYGLGRQYAALDLDTLAKNLKVRPYLRNLA
jgi:hypothetical protein